MSDDQKAAKVTFYAIAVMGLAFLAGAACLLRTFN
jgi:hypothetical protein